MTLTKLLSCFRCSVIEVFVKYLIVYPKENPLGKRLLTAILLCSTSLAFMATSFQLLVDYRSDVSGIELRMHEIERSYLASMGESLWNMDSKQIQIQLNGIANLPDIPFAQVKDIQGQVLARAGSSSSQFKTFNRTIPIQFIADPVSRKTIFLGTLEVSATMDRIYKRLWDKAFVIFVSQTAKTLLVAIFILVTFNYLVTRHLVTMAAYVRKLNLSQLSVPLVLSRKAPPQTDELDVMVLAFNDMTEAIKRDVSELTEYRTELEELVIKRTTELAQKISELEENEERYRKLVEISPDAIIVEREGKIIFVNSGALKLIGADRPEQLTGMSMIELIPSDWHEIAQDHLEKLLANEKELRPFEAKMMRFDDTVIDVEISRSFFHDRGLLAIQTVAHDITKHKHYEAQLRTQALHDALTGLPNRILLMDRLEHAIALAERGNYAVFVLFFDLDRFKYVNDTLGHDAGDQLLKIITKRVLQCIRKSDTFARLGGDEFVLVLGNIASEDLVNQLLSRVVSAINESIIIEGQNITMTSSIGISTYPKDGKDSATLLKYADTAMYRAKELGRNGIQHYSPEMLTHTSEYMAMESRLRQALENKEFVLYYQPILDLRSGKIIGAEALIRWQHPEFGLLPPARFIPVAEETGLIVNIGEWVMHAACVQAKIWEKAGLMPIRIAINLSAQQLFSPYFEDKVKQVFVDTGLSPHSIEFEITETMSMKDPEHVVGLLQRLKAIGAHIAIDDFGTGYSNFGYLTRFSIDHLKLDRSFVQNIKNNLNDAVLASSMIGLAHNLGLSVVAEGVEDKEQLTDLVAYGCDEMQGYYFSPPVPPEAFAEFLKGNKSLDLSLKG